MHHVIIRRIERGEIYSDDHDRDNFIERLGDIVTETETFCFAWALIPNRVHILSSELGIDPEQVWMPGKHPITVKARSLLCYWAVRKVGFSATELSKKLGISQPSVSISVKRGERIAEAEQLKLV